jgi:hypothetical protein
VVHYGADRIETVSQIGVSAPQVIEFAAELEQLRPQHGATVKNATQSWSACMAKNGYSYHQPQAVFVQERQDIYGRGNGPISTSAPVSAGASQAQIAAAVTDATCAQSADLAGIYFAVQASYEQQLVNANQQALTSAVQRYRTAYQIELSRLPAVLRTAKAIPVPAGRTARSQRSGRRHPRVFVHVSADVATLGSGAALPSGNSRRQAAHGTRYSGRQQGP